MITVLRVEPGKAPELVEIEDSLESLQKEVGGYIEGVYPWDEPVAIICDEEAKLTGKELNRALRDEDGHIYDIVAGTFLIVGLGAEDFISIGDYAEKYSKMFQRPEKFVRMGGKVVCC